MTKKKKKFIKTSEYDEYWDRRTGREILLQRLQEADQVVADMQGLYRETYEEILADLERFYARVMTEEGFDRQAALENIAFGQKHLDELEAYIKRFDELGAMDPALFAEYKAIARAKHVSRFDKLQAQVNAEMIKLASVQDDRVNAFLQDMAERDYYDVFYREYRKGNPGAVKAMAASSVFIDPKIAKKIVHTNWSGADFSQAIWHREFDLAAKIKRAVWRNVIQGKSLKECAKELETNLDDDRKYAAMRLVRTETTYVHSQVRKMAYEDTEVKKYRFSAVLDSRTSDLCAGLHGKVFKLEDATPGVNMPPMHPNCRSDIYAEYDKPLMEGGEYLMRTPDGKKVRVPADMAKDEWERMYKGGGGKSKPGKAETVAIAGVFPGRPMTFEEADGSKANPNFKKDAKYTMNCQTCVVAYEARRRGYDVEAVGYSKGSKLEELARATNHAWIDPETGKFPKYIEVSVMSNINTPTRYLKYLNETLEDGIRYTMEFGWKGSRDGHIVHVFKDSTGIMIYDPQSGLVEKDVKKYLGRIKFTEQIYGEKYTFAPRLLAVQRYDFNREIVDDILKKAGKDDD